MRIPLQRLLPGMTRRLPKPQPVLPPASWERVSTPHTEGLAIQAARGPTQQWLPGFEPQDSRVIGDVLGGNTIEDLLTEVADARMQGYGRLTLDDQQGGHGSWHDQPAGYVFAEPGVEDRDPLAFLLAWSALSQRRREELFRRGLGRKYWD
jgi:hypothetical protein